MVNPENIVVETKNLVKRYDQGEQEVFALGGVSLQFERACFAALSGPSGSGKTTLLNLIGGVDTPTSGEVYVSGRRISHCNRKERADLRLQHIGFIFQAYNLIPVLSAEENIAFVMQLQGVPENIRRTRVAELLERFEMGNLKSRRPNELSGGQQQRVAIARALAARPDIILADEPTANLDTKNAEAILALMVSLNREEGVSFIFSTHDPRVIKFAKRRIGMQDGKVVSDQ